MSVHEDRRDVTTQRIPFDALVELGGAADSPAFEAQGVDVSADGMHLRTAYLPDVGQPLVCRFDGAGQQIAAEANVVWSKEGPRGGEFGIRFTNVDADGAAALTAMCGIVSSADAVPAPTAEVNPGTRVRLHIEGLGSPMKARVRGATEDAMLVGSNLEFLRVGRPLELEDVDHGGKRAAHIERVDVEVDRESKVPQLIVTLRYGDVPEVVDYAEPVTPAPAAEPAEQRPRASTLDDAERALAKSMRTGWSHVAASWGPAVSRLSARAATTMGLLWNKAFERATQSARRRTTSPPPGGALHASGRKVVREGSMPEIAARSRLGRKAMIALGATSGVLVVVLAVAWLKPKSPPPAAAPVASAEAPAVTATAAAEPAPAAPIQANVPLYGPTTLSTNEPVAAPAAPAAPAAAPVETAAAVVDSAAAGDAFESGSPDKSDAASAKKVAAFSRGKVTHAITLRLRTDGTITALHGARTPTGFTVSLPGRKSLDSSAGLASRDPRIASVKVTGGSKGAEVSVQFKDGVPPYAARARGRDLVIALGRSDAKADSVDKVGKTVAKKGTHRPHHRGN